MKIRAGFVSNSSSTSFLIIADGDLDRKGFLDLMGVDAKSPLAGLFTTLYESILDNSRETVDLSKVDPNVPMKDWFTDLRNDLTPRMLEKLEEGRARGLKVYHGQLRTESNNVECFFCTDSFEVENDRIYFNALECSF